LINGHLLKRSFYGLYNSAGVENGSEVTTDNASKVEKFGSSVKSEKKV
jgi:hypothetical protein